MDQYDRAIENVFNAPEGNEPALICVIGGNQSTTDSLRANLEVAGHKIICIPSVSEYETYLSENQVDMAIVSCEHPKECVDVFEITSLLSDETVVSGFSTNPSYKSAIDFIRMGGADFYSFPEDLSVVAKRVETILNQLRTNIEARENTSQIVDLCNQINDARHQAQDEKDSLSSDLANSYCENEKKMRKVAMGAEFKTLLSQELEVESMLRTALGYMLTRVGAMNTAVFLREGDVDWGVGAFVNYDRQGDQFQELLTNLSSVICPIVACESRLKKYTDGESFANLLELDVEDFTGSEVVTCGSFHEGRCMAVMVFFRSDAKPFGEESIEAIDVMRQIFGQQLSTILRIHKRAETTWPSESVDDDDWSFGKAA